MSGKFLARVSALSLAFMLAACGGDDNSTPLVDVSPDPTPTTPPDSGTPESPATPETPDNNLKDRLIIGSDASGTFVKSEIHAERTNLTIDSETSGSTKISLQIVDPENSNTLAVGTENTVRFFSGCLAAGWAQMDNDQVTTEAGTVLATYTPLASCTGEDVLYAKLNDDSENLAKVAFTINPQGGATTPGTTQVGSLDAGGTFRPGVIRVEQPALVLDASGEASTDIIVNVQTGGQPASGVSYTAQFTSMCIDAGRASVSGTNTTQSGAILATYNASPDCLGTDNVVVFLNGDSTLKASADIIVSDTKLAIGSYDGAGAFTASLAASKSQLDYNTEAEPTTEIRSVIAKVDDTGTFIEQLTGFQSSVEFFSTCLDSDLATIETTGTTESGELISTYRAQGCVGEDTIYARIGGTSTLASTTVDITARKDQELALGYFDGAGTFTAGVIGNTRSTPLPLGVQTKLYLSIADALTQAQIKGQPLTVQLSSRCGEQPGATSPLSTENASVSLGYIEVLYTAQGCGSLTADLVRAELTGAEGVTAIAEATIELAELPANSLTAGLPTPNSIAPAWYSTDGRETTSTLRVQLKDNQNNGVDGEIVTFALDNPGAVDVAVLEPVNGGETDNDGYAEVKIKAVEDFDNVVFRVIASYTDVNGNLLEAYSAPIAVNSKLPFAERFSLSTSNFAPDTQPGKDGIQVQLTLLAADDQGNRIRGNTVVNFETDQGSIDPECILDNDGRCTVTWESLGINDTFATIRAYTHGRLADANGLPSGTGEIQSFATMLMSSSDNVQVLLERTSPVGGNIDAESNTYCATTWVNLPGETIRFSPPTGTEILFELTEGEFINEASSSNTIPSSSSLLTLPGYTACTKVRPTETIEEIEISDGSGGVTIVEQTTLDIELSVTVTPPADAAMPATDYTTETYQF